MRTRLRLLATVPVAAAGLLGTALPAFAAADITADQAGQIAVDNYGGHVLNVESDTADGQPSWEVEIDGSAVGHIEIDVAKSSGDLLACESDEGEGSCLSAAVTGSDGGAGAGGTDEGTGNQVQPMPSGGADTGGGSTSGMEDTGLLAVGGVAMLAAGGVALWRRRIVE